MQAPLRAQLVIYIFTGLCVATDFTAALQTDRCVLLTNNLRHKPYQVHYMEPDLALNSSGVFERLYASRPTARFLPRRSVETGGADKAFSDLSRDAVNQDAG